MFVKSVIKGLKMIINLRRKNMIKYLNYFVDKYPAYFTLSSVISILFIAWIFYEIIMVVMGNGK